MNPLKKLAGQTAIYGLGSILGRFLNYLLVPLHTKEGTGFDPEQFGIITEMYAYVAFLVVFLTYGLETSFFRFSTQKGFDRKGIYSTAVYALLISTGLFILLANVFNEPTAVWLQYPDHAEYVTWFAIIVGLDAVASLPMALLRLENKAKRFAIVNLVNVGVNIVLNLFWLGFCRSYYGEIDNWVIDTFYDPEIGVGYVFIANLVASIIKFLMLAPELLKARYGAQFVLLKQMLIYGLPLMIAGLAGIINETLDRVLLKNILQDKMTLEEAQFQLGVYGASYKLSIVMNLFLQAFRYAAEPFFFAQEKERNAHEVYARIMNYFVILLASIFLVVTLYLDIFKYFIPNEEYWVGLRVVPILLMANLFLGVYYNQSIWYKLGKKTHFGAYIAVFGAVITIALNLWLIPIMGYMGSAWATLACYGSMVVLSYMLGQKHYPVAYDIKRIFLYLSTAAGLYLASVYLATASLGINYLINTLLLLAFLALVFLMEKGNWKKSISNS